MEKVFTTIIEQAPIITEEEFSIFLSCASDAYGQFFWGLLVQIDGNHRLFGRMCSIDFMNGFFWGVGMISEYSTIAPGRPKKITLNISINCSVIFGFDQNIGNIHSSPKDGIPPKLQKGIDQIIANLKEPEPVECIDPI